MVVLKRCFALMMVLALLSACGGGIPGVQWQLKISGAVGSPLVLSYGDLAAMPQVELKDILMKKSQGPDEVTSWVGVPLTEIWKRAGVSDLRAVLATAADGYAVEIPASELEGAIIALKDGRGWIVETDPERGPIRLVCPHAPGNRWVFQLVELQVIGP